MIISFLAHDADVRAILRRIDYRFHDGRAVLAQAFLHRRLEVGKRAHPAAPGAERRRCR